MQGLQYLVSTLIYWVVVPAIMIRVFVFATDMVSAAPSAEVKASAKAGLWGGVIIFIIFLITQIDSMHLPDFTKKGVFDINLWLILIGLVIGLILLFIVKSLMTPVKVGLFVLILVVASSCSFYSYIFIDGVRSSVLSATLGVGLGAMLHIIIFPASVKDFF